MTVRIYRSTDFGALPIAKTSGQLADVYKACLQDGYGDQTVTLTRVGTTVTVTTPLAHGLSHLAKYNIAGAVEPEYNGDHSVKVISSTELTYEINTAPATPATGTITGRLNGAGWTQPYASGNIRSFKQGAGSNGLSFQLDDSSSNSYAKVRGYETMGDAGSGAGPFPTQAQNSNGLYVMKSSNTTERDWIIVATESQFFYHINSNGATTTCQGMFFGDFDPELVSESYNTVLIAGLSTTPSNSAQFARVSNNAGSVSTSMYVARNYSGIGGAEKINVMTHPGYGGSYTGTGKLAYPDPTRNALIVADINVNSLNVQRGKLKGFLDPLHLEPFSHLDIIEGSGIFAGKTFQILEMNSTAQFLIEISDTF